MAHMVLMVMPKTVLTISTEDHHEISSPSQLATKKKQPQSDERTESKTVHVQIVDHASDSSSPTTPAPAPAIPAAVGGGVTDAVIEIPQLDPNGSVEENKPTTPIVSTSEAAQSSPDVVTPAVSEPLPVAQAAPAPIDPHPDTWVSLASPEDRKKFLEKQGLPDDPRHDVVRVMVAVFLKQKLVDLGLIGRARFFEDDTQNFVQVVFPVRTVLEAEKLTTQLLVDGFDDFGYICVIPVSLAFGLDTLDPKRLTGDTASQASDFEPDEDIKKEKERDNEGEDDDFAQFAETAKARISVQQVVDQIRSAARFSFDFLMLTITASILAAAGLAVNSSVVVVASMLVSPIMGPVLGVTFGSVIRDDRLFRQSLRTELIALLVCVFVGFVVGVCFAPFSETWDWPTSEMSSRGEWSALLIGLAIAIPSGFGVALSVLGNNTSSLVGVAISASLLPPAVNTGLLFAHEVVNRPNGNEIRLAVVSLLLTLENILLMFKFKEVAPIPHKSEFWKKNVRVARHYNKPIDQTEREVFQKHLQRIFRATYGEDVAGDDDAALRTLGGRTSAHLTVGPVDTSPTARGTQRTFSTLFDASTMVPAGRGGFFPPAEQPLRLRNAAKQRGGLDLWERQFARKKKPTLMDPALFERR